MGLLDKFKKNKTQEPPPKPKIVTKREYAISKRKKLIGHFEQEKNWRGFKRINIPNRHYQEALDNLDHFRKTKDFRESKYGGDTIVLDDSVIDIYLSSALESKSPAICVYVDDLFIGANIVASEKAKETLAALQNGDITAVHVIIDFCTDVTGKIVYDTYLTTNIK